jgi:hypothetical protein
METILAPLAPLDGLEVPVDTGLPPPQAIASATVAVKIETMSLRMAASG